MNDTTLFHKNRAGKILLTAALILSLILPVCTVVARIVGLRLILSNYFILVWLIFLLTSGALLVLWKSGASSGKGVGRMAAVLLPVSMIDGFFCLIREENVLTIAGAAACLIAAVILFSRLAGKTRLKWVSVGLTVTGVLLSLVILPFVLIASLLFGSSETVRSVESPEGTYVAQVISDDQGAMGGNTLVEVYRPGRTVNLILIRLEDTPRRIYTGSFGESKTLSVIWQDERTLLIGGVQYPVE